MLFKLIVWGVVFYLIFRAARSWISGPAKHQPSMKPPGHPPGTGQVDDIMIQDPVCGIHFPKREGIVHRHNGRDIYFCSTQCRDRFIAEQERGQ